MGATLMTYSNPLGERDKAQLAALAEPAVTITVHGPRGDEVVDLNGFEASGLSGANWSRLHAAVESCRALRPVEHPGGVDGWWAERCPTAECDYCGAEVPEDELRPAGDALRDPATGRALRQARACRCCSDGCGPDCCGEG